MLSKKNRAFKKSTLKADLKNTDLVASIILQNIEDGVVLIDANQRIINFNLGASRITGLTIDQALNQPWVNVLKFVDKHGINKVDEENPLKQIFNKKEVVRHQEIFILSDKKTKIPLHLIASPLMNHSGQIEAVIIVMRNMSSEAQEEEAKTDFVSTASHEMRTPLAALEGYLSLILKQNLDAQTLEYAQKAHLSVLHLGKLFKNLLITSQSEDGQLSHYPQIFVLNELLAQIVIEAQKQANLKQINLEIISAPAHAENEEINGMKYHLNADPQRIQELLNNILDNAIKYTDSGGQINISLKPVNGFVQIKIEDSGLGVSPKDTPHLFQKFYRVDNAQPGMGLGLFICKKIVELYQGDIWLESEVGRGSIFYINLPKHTPLKA